MLRTSGRRMRVHGDTVRRADAVRRGVRCYVRPLAHVQARCAVACAPQRTVQNAAAADAEADADALCVGVGYVGALWGGVCGAAAAEADDVRGRRSYVGAGPGAGASTAEAEREGMSGGAVYNEGCGGGGSGFAFVRGGGSWRCAR